METYALDVERVAVDFDRYDDLVINSLRLSLEAIRKQVDAFPFCTERYSTTCQRSSFKRSREIAFPRK